MQLVRWLVEMQLPAAI